VTAPPNTDYTAKAKVAYDEALRLIQTQQERLADTRARASVILSAASIAAAFLGASALDNHRAFEAATWVATVAFVIVASIAVALLVPWPGWRFTNYPKKLVTDYAERADLSLGETYGYLAGYTDDHYVHNEKRMTWRYWLLAASCLALLVEVVFFLIDLTNRGVGTGG
jgi:hypothetical protein